MKVSLVDGAAPNASDVELVEVHLRTTFMLVAPRTSAELVSVGSPMTS